jgi:GDPmannose 4,6-dehydratase
MRRALICGISGQDGTYLGKLLLEKGYEVFGTSRDAETASFSNLRRLGISGEIHLMSLSLNDFRSILQVLVRVQPDEIYNLAGQSSVALSFQQPVETFESISVGTLNLLEAIRFLGGAPKFYNACSTECFGHTGSIPSSEDSPFNPRSPYAVAKAAAFWQVANYREAYSLFACSGLLSNHDSPLRPERFVTQKIVSAAFRISRGSTERLSLGNIEITRDWGWAEEYVVAMWLMLQQEFPQDFVIATGASFPLSEFVTEAFGCVGLDWRQHVDHDASLFRPTDIAVSRLDPSKAGVLLNWRAKKQMKEIVTAMSEACHARLAI